MAYQPANLESVVKAKRSFDSCTKRRLLRPDQDPVDNWRKWLNNEYDKLPEGPTRYWYAGTVVSSLSVALDPTVFPIRCVGKHNSQNDFAFPRSHHKFVVFCKLKEGEDEDTFLRITHYAVWTGSFNFSKAASASLENSLVIADTKIVHAYYQERIASREILRCPLQASPFLRLCTDAVLQGRNIADQLGSGRSTWHSLERKRKIFHEATRGRSLSPPHTDRLLHVSRGGECGTVIELSGTTGITPTNRPSVS